MANDPIADCRMLVYFEPMVRFDAQRWLCLIRRTVMLALALAVFVRALIPAGYMLSPQPGLGLAGLVICSSKAAMGEPPVVLNGTADHDKAPAGGGDNICSFAAAVANSVPPPLQLDVAYFVMLDRVPAIALPDVAPSVFDTGSPLGARAPPVIG